MTLKRLLITGVAAAALVLASGCKTAGTRTTTTDTNNGMYGTSSTVTSSDNGTTSSSTTSTSNLSSTSNSSAPATMSGTTGTTTTSLTDQQNGTTTTTSPNSTTVSRSETTTIVYPNGTVKTLTPNDTASATMTSGSTLDTTNTSTTVPQPVPGSIVTRTVTTVTTKTTTPAVVSLPGQPATATATATTTPANNYPPMTSSTTVYQPYPVYQGGRHYPNLDFLVFANRASFSTDNNALSGTLNSGNLRTDFNNENGYGLGLNAYMGRHLSLEFTASRVKPRATFTPTNAAVNPITGMRVQMTPITGALDWHLAPHTSLDLYFGGGAAYVMFKGDNSFNAGNSGLTSVKFRDEWGPMVNGGLSFGLGRSVAIDLGAKYMWVRANANSTFNGVTIGNVGNSSHIGVNPFIISAGLRFGF